MITFTSLKAQLKLQLMGCIDEAAQFSALHRQKLSVRKRGRALPFAVKRKISQSMKGTSNFAGKSHTSIGKQNISDGRGHYDPIKGKKWYVNKHTSKTWRKTRNPTEVIFQHGRIVRRGKGLPEGVIAFKDYIIVEAYYPGNLGVQELVKFHQMASKEHKDLLKKHIANNDRDKAFDLITKVTGMKLARD